MFRVVLFSIFVVVASADKDMGKCRQLLHPDSLKCCTKIPFPPASAASDEIKECMDMPFKPRSCDREECFAKKRGYYVSGGGLDTEAMIPILEKEFEKSPEFLAAIKENCLKDVSKYGPPDMCDLMKLRHCIQAQMLKQCPEWSNEGKCSGMKDLIDECKQKFE